MFLIQRRNQMRYRCSTRIETEKETEQLDNDNDNDTLREVRPTTVRGL